MNDIPEFPPSDLICTPAEWRQFYQQGCRAYGEGAAGCIGPAGKGKGPWESGWKKAQDLDMAMRAA